MNNKQSTMIINIEGVDGNRIKYPNKLLRESLYQDIKRKIKRSGN